MGEIDPVEFGKLVNAVQTLTRENQILFKDLAAIQADISDIKQSMSGKIGIVLGVMIACGGLGAGVHKALEYVFK